MPTLHYIFDPLCGWCYAAAPLIQTAQKENGLAVQLHAGGMLTGSNRRTITPEWRANVMPHDQRITHMTGQPFGQAYFDGLLRQHGTVLDSAPPITAILAAEQLAGRGLDMLHQLQTAYYVDGRAISDPAILQAIAQEMALPDAAFHQTFDQLRGDATAQHIAASRQLLDEVGGRGFPTLVWQDDAQKIVLDIAPWLGRPDQWCHYLAELMGTASIQAT